MTETIRLGLVGDNIAKSLSPRLHMLAAAQNGRRVVYDRLMPAEHGMTFEALFDDVSAAGYRGVNITYPYKENAAARVKIDDPLVAAIGAVNTVLFDEGGPHGFNTDYSGFVAAYRRIRGDALPGTVLMIGAGGVGKAIAFALVALGLRAFHIVDRDVSRAESLAQALKAARPDLLTETGADAAVLARGVAGLVNCTPVGMVGHEGTPLARAAMAGAQWAFDAVYTPPETRFLQDADAEGLQVISGYELFIGQGVDAWRIFTGLPVDEVRLREAMAD
ncbi:shikimate dehydrogenase family protein [Mycoplana rhizolycopersici]|uniref:shikimate dehydrogenase (NADP(+)) n=1 Tax=Mycoplana rhizolycopersici TaxID=2746702 RepID=A0ABX2QNF0_9HYPH|nr:shikimate dehydrogenase [Rhizobium rhizolycopersici]NVP58427.1 shikimate dehydrogenase [Rhizobium rhizolycopersici]